MSKRILIVRLSAIGDVIHSTPVARQIKRHYPDCHLAWVVEAKGLAGIAHNPHLDEIIVMDTRRPTSWWEMWKRLRHQYDITVDVQCLLKAGLVTGVSGSPLRLGREDAREGARLFYNHLGPSRMDHIYISQVYLEQCAELGLDVNDYVPELFLAEAEQAFAADLWRTLGLDGGQPVVGLIAFNAEPTRAWPVERYGSIGDTLAGQYGAQCVIFGSKAERPQAEALAATMRSRPVILAGETSLGQAAACLQRCNLAVGADTGLIHYAFALGTPLVCLLGPSPLRNGPKSDRAITVATPCEYRYCRPSAKCRRGSGRPCLDEITVEMALEAAGKLLGRHGAS